MLKDSFGRTIEYMRVSVTDRCNLRCRYCMPDGVVLAKMEDILTFEEIGAVCRAAAGLGIGRIKVTGGEPLARRGCADLVGSLKRIPGIRQVTLTTNGVLLAEHLPALLQAGLDAVNVSLDTLDRERYAAITGRDALDGALRGISAAISSGIPVKLNAVLEEGVNDDEALSLALLAKTQPLHVRFIEMMPIGYGKQVRGVSNDTVRERLLAAFPDMRPDPAPYGNGPAVYMHVPGWQGSIGFISAIHGKFCDSCNRLRLTAKGQLKPCLCYGETEDLRRILRSGLSEEEIQVRLTKAITKAVREKPLMHCFEEPERVTETARMASIGG